MLLVSLFFCLEGGFPLWVRLEDLLLIFCVCTAVGMLRQVEKHKGGDWLQIDVWTVRLHPSFFYITAVAPNSPSGEIANIHSSLGTSGRKQSF